MKVPYNIRPPADHPGHGLSRCTPSPKAWGT